MAAGGGPFQLFVSLLQYHHMHYCLIHEAFLLRLIPHQRRESEHADQMQAAGRAIRASPLHFHHAQARAIAYPPFLHRPSFAPFLNARPFSSTLHKLSQLKWPFESEADIAARRQWLDYFAGKDLSQGPERASIDVSYARSSGPGGQHVNKTSSKAVVKLDLADAVGNASASAASTNGWLQPSIAKQLSMHSPYYVPSSHSLQISSMRSRSAPANLEDALNKLQAHIMDIASEDLPGETSEAQKKRVHALERREQAKMKRVKEKRRDVKQGRGKVSL